jgi:hypothetical protein
MPVCSAGPPDTRLLTLATLSVCQSSLPKYAPTPTASSAAVFSLHESLYKTHSVPRQICPMEALHWDPSSCCAGFLKPVLIFPSCNRNDARGHGLYWRTHCWAAKEWAYSARTSTGISLLVVVGCKIGTGHFFASGKGNNLVVVLIFGFLAFGCLHQTLVPWVYSHGLIFSLSKFPP